MPRKIFIVGDHGQMAQALARIYSARGDMVKSVGRAKVDIADESAVRSTILAFRPDLVINAAAYTAVDKAEDDADQAYRVNRDGARHVAAASRATAAPLIHISTNYVFDGTKSTPYLETDLTNPDRNLRAIEARRRSGGHRRNTGPRDLAHELGLQCGWQQFRQDDAAFGERTQ